MSKRGNGPLAVAAAAAGEFLQHQGPSQAAALAFYALAAVLPLAVCLTILADYLAGTTGEADRFILDGLNAAIPWLAAMPEGRLAGLVASLRRFGGPSLALFILASACLFSALRKDLALPYALRPSGGLRRFGRGVLALAAGPILCASLLCLLVFILALRQSGPSFDGALLSQSIHRISTLWAFLGMTCLYFCLYALLLPGRRAMGAAAVLCLVLAGCAHVPAFVFTAFADAPAGPSLPAGLTIPEGLALESGGSPASGAFGAVLFFLIWLDFVMALAVFGGHYLRLWENRRGETVRPGSNAGRSTRTPQARQYFEEDA